MATPAAAREFKCIQPEEHFRQHVENGVRPDGREDLCALRPVSISAGTISTADGSAVVKQGDTVVVCGIKLELAPPKPEDPAKGFLVPNVELPPICHSQFRPGPPSEQAQTASNFLRQVIDNSRLVNLEDLCVKPGKLAWVLNVDVMCLNHDGNVIDAAVKASVAALRNLTLPAVVVESDEDNAVAEDVIKVDASDRSPLRLGGQPTSCTMAVFEDRILTDPTAEEEGLASSVVSVALDPSSGVLCQLQKAGGAPISRERLQECTALAKKQAKRIAKMVEAAAPARI